MSENPKETILAAIRQYQGDNLYRARAAFRGLSPEQMQEEHGQSGRTRAQVLRDYEEHERECDAAVEWLRRTP